MPLDLIYKELLLDCASCFLHST